MVQHVNTPALKKQWVLDAQWTDCPPEVEKVIVGLWSWKELGNDNYMIRNTLGEFKAWNTSSYDITVQEWQELPESQKSLSGLGWGWVSTKLDMQPLIDYLEQNDVKDDDQVILHWWW